MHRFRYAAALAFFVPTLLFAQAQGRVKGTVLSSTGKPIPGAEVVITCPEVGSYRKEMKTDEDGVFTTLIVDATKRYLFHVEADGYQSLEQLNKPLIGGQTLELEFVLKTIEEAREEARAEAMEEPGVREYREGMELLDAGKDAEARAKFRAALAARPDLHVAWAQIGQIDLKLGDNEAALKAAKKCLEMSPNFVACLALAANASQALGDQEAYEQYMASYKFYNPQDPVVLFNEAVEFLNEGDDAEAKSLLLEVLEIDPQFADALYQLGMVYVREGDMAQAKELLQKFVDVAPDHPDAPTANEMLKYL